MSVDHDLDSSPTAVVPATDGRLLRSERTRQAIVDALLDLIKGGTLRPSSAEIAEKAGVTQRTLFNQFGAMDTLLEAVGQRHVERVAHLIPQVIEGTVDERAARFCDELAVLLEEVMNIRWAVLTSPEGMERFAHGPGLLTTVLRHQVQEAFDAELSALDLVDRAQVLDAVEIETDPLTWRMRRLQQHKTPDEARALVERVILSLLRGPRSR